MNQSIMDRANEAIFHMQLNSREAIRYVVKNAVTDEKTAGQAVRQVMVGYKL